MKKRKIIKYLFEPAAFPAYFTYGIWLHPKPLPPAGLHSEIAKSDVRANLSKKL